MSSEYSQEIKKTNELLKFLDLIEILNLSNLLNIDDFLAILEENIVCEIPNKSSIMAKIIKIFKEEPEKSNHEVFDKADNSVETTIISTSE
ncbi:809_t:CDS:1, partial [Racocetra persica]